METEFALTGVRLPRTHIAQLDQIATQKRVSRNTVILWALDAYLAHIFLPDRPSGKTIDQDDSQSTDQAA